jgi:hypothetical protein
LTRQSIFFATIGGTIFALRARWMRGSSPRMTAVGVSAPTSLSAVIRRESGGPSIPERLRLISDFLEYWIARSSRATT